jgi:ribosomal protein L22
MSSCNSVKYNSGGRSMIQSHEKIAVLQPNVLINFEGDNDEVKSLEKNDAINLQAEIYDWLQRRRFENKVAVEIMDLNESNINLASISELELSVMKTSEICNLLNVDAVLSSNFILEKPVSQESTKSFANLTQTDLSTNKIKVKLALHKSETSDVIWNFDKEVEGNNETTYKQLVDKILSKAIKKMPYYNKKFKFARDTKINLSELR